ncbi:hypothetical protein PsYK624_007040 [Phanerochaete sordida]|uniref:Transmembrane protein n=1 Tax=Phanerochaete sordida TaxID=48140 RepID=A0A9P3L854_9APHY|nr:hypothetical protein PsYK624_007040 [Phanerochaete sordida]
MTEQPRRIVAVQATEPIHCGALSTFNAWATNMAVLCGTNALMVRTAELWDNAVAVVLPLALLGCVHWAILWRAIFLVDAAWDVNVKDCAVVSQDHGFLDASFFTTMAVSLVVLLITAVPLARKRKQLNVQKMFFKDGLAYFCVPFLCSIVPAVLNALDLNSVLNLVTVIPAATLSSVAACRLVMRRARPPPDVYVQGPVRLTENAQLRLPGGRGGRPSFAVGIRPTPEVHVTTDRITVQDFPAVPPRAKRSSTRTSLDDEELAYEK